MKLKPSCLTSGYFVLLGARGLILLNIKGLLLWIGFSYILLAIKKPSIFSILTSIELSSI